MNDDLEQRHDAICKTRRSSTGAFVPVIRTVDSPDEIVEKVFDQANAATRKHSFEEPRAKLVDSSFRGPDIAKVVQWAQEYRGIEFSPHHLIVLDGITVQDRESCLLISIRGLPSPKHKGLEQHYQIIRADFASSVINLMTKEMAVGEDEMLEGDYDGFDGVLRDEVRDEWERRYYGSKDS